VGQRRDAQNSRMQERVHTWGREQRRDGASEWQTTGFSTVIGELEAKSARRSRRRQRRSGYLRFALPFLLVFVAGGVAVAALAQYLQR